MKTFRTEYKNEGNIIKNDSNPLSVLKQIMELSSNIINPITLNKKKKKSSKIIKH